MHTGSFGSWQAGVSAGFLCAGLYGNRREVLEKSESEVQG